MSKTDQLFRINNFKLLYRILDKDPGCFYDCTRTNPNKKIFHKPIKK